MDPRGHDIRLERHDFRWWEWGDPEAPPLVFLHGVFTHARMYSSLLKGLASAGRRVVALDQRGHGDSAHPGDYDRELWIDDIQELCVGLDLGDVDVVGHSMGAGHGAGFAARRPEAVRRLALLDHPFWNLSSQDQQNEFWTRCGTLVPKGGFASRDEYIATACEQFPRASATEVAVNASELAPTADGRVNWRRPPDPRVFGASRRSDAEWQDMFTKIECPVLIARAAESELFAGSASEVAAAFSSGRCCDVPASGHMIMWENVPGWVDVVSKFLQPG